MIENSENVEDVLIMRFVGISVAVAMTCGVPLGADTLTGHVAADGLRSHEDVVVYIEKIPGETFPSQRENAVMDQQDMVFSPRVLPVLAGSTVDFLNSDSVAHNVFSPDSCADEFDLGNWTRGEVRSKTFDKPCAATILCFVHPGMEAFVVAVPTPFFSKTDASGRFEIAGIPAGKYTVTAWHPTLKSVSQEVTVKGTTSLDLTLRR